MEFLVILVGIVFLVAALAILGSRTESAKSGEQPAPAADPRQNFKPVVLAGPAWCEFEIVGESFRQEALRSIAGDGGEEGVSHHCRARLVHEYGNPHDANAVRVEIDGLHVGYLPGPSAIDFRSQMRAIGCEGRDAVCAAYINGGWVERKKRRHYGVKLGLHWPVREQVA